MPKTKNFVPTSAPTNTHVRAVDGVSRDASLHSLLESCFRFGKYPPQELFRWLIEDVLAEFGVRKQAPLPEDARAWVAGAAEIYGKLAVRHPFCDVLGILYQSIGSRGHRGALGQFFTPSPVGALMAAMTAGVEDRATDAALLRACEPACGSGALLLAFMQAQVQVHGEKALRRWSLTAIDLDPLCAQMCAAQVLSNLLLQRIELAELVVYRGNALGPSTGLSVVVHTSHIDLKPDLVLPALHPSRLLALRHACLTQVNDADDSVSGIRVADQKAPTASGIPTEDASTEVDLFADC